jgi:hypothetical protein
MKVEVGFTSAQGTAVPRAAVVSPKRLRADANSPTRMLAARTVFFTDL